MFARSLLSDISELSPKGRAGDFIVVYSVIIALDGSRIGARNKALSKGTDGELSLALPLSLSLSG